MKFLFFGLGAVSSVAVKALYELCAKANKESVSFIFVVRDTKRAKKYFFHPQDSEMDLEFLEVESFEAVFENEKYIKKLQGVDLLINSATPEFNIDIMHLALRLEANYADLSSDIYKDEALSSLKFPQQILDEDFRAKDRFALINLGVSPGVTNFLIGERIEDFRTLPYVTKVKKIELNLLEEIRSNELIFSWSPRVALEEIAAKPLYFKDDSPKIIEPFSKSKTYKFPYFKNLVDLYPVFQEEILSLKQSFSEVENIRMYVGGSEMELMKSLYQLNLLTTFSINNILNEVMPKMKEPLAIEGYMRDKVIKFAEFSAVSDIYIEIFYPKEKKPIKCVESIGVSFNRYLELLNTPYSGATYISYPTGIGAAILLYYTLLSSRKREIKGVVLPERLPVLLDTGLKDIVKRELSTYGLNIFSSMSKKVGDESSKLSKKGW